MDTRLRGFPGITDVTWDVGTALLSAGGPLTVVELVGVTGRSASAIRRALVDMEDKNWVERCVGRRDGVPTGSHLWSYTEPGRREAERTFGDGPDEEAAP